MHSFHADLLPLIDKRNPTQEKVHGGKCFFAFVRKICLWDVAADTTRFIMVFNDVGQKSDFTCAKLAVKHNLFIHCLNPSVPLCHTAPVKNQIWKKITILPDKRADFGFFIIKYFPYGKIIVLIKCLPIHFS